jgi:hypothetical protein
VTDEATDAEKLPCSLSDDEVRQRGEELARRIRAREELDEARRENQKDYRDRLAELDLEIATLAREVRDRTAYREVGVVMHRNLATRTVEWVRRDTGEVVRQRPMTDDELQGQLWELERRQDGVKVPSAAESEDQGDA